VIRRLLLHLLARACGADFAAITEEEPDDA
jgi:hypothetical protein